MMASEDDMRLFKAVYEGDLASLEDIRLDDDHIKNARFFIQTDEICLCATAFENLGLEFTNIASPSSKHTEIEFDFQQANQEMPNICSVDDDMSCMSQSWYSSRRVYEPPLYHWLQLGRCSHMSVRSEEDEDEDLLEDMEDCTSDNNDDMSPVDHADIHDDDPATDIDLEVYGIRMSPCTPIQAFLQSDIPRYNSPSLREQVRRLSLIEETTEKTIGPLSVTDEELTGQLNRQLSLVDEGVEITADVIDESQDSGDVILSPQEGEMLSLGSGPSYHDNLAMMGLIRPCDQADTDVIDNQIGTYRYPYIHGFDPVDSEVSSGCLVSDIKQAGVSSMHVAAARGYNDVIVYLTERGCTVDCLTTDAEETPLHLAVRWGHCHSTKLLLEKGANPLHQSAMECSPIHVAIELSCHQCLTAMLAYLPDAVDISIRQMLLVFVLSKDEVGLTTLLLDKFNMDINETLPDGLQTLLHKAALFGSQRCVRFLIEKGAHLDSPSGEGETPLHLAAGNGHVDAIDALIGAGAVPRPSPNWMIGDNQTPLMLAAYNNFPNAVMSLLGYDEVNTSSEYGDTALHYAAFRGCEESVCALLGAGASVNARNDYGASPLWNGACYWEIVRAMLQHGATFHVNSVGHNLDHVQGAVYDSPRTPLEVCLEEGFLDSARILIKAGARMHRLKLHSILEETHIRYGNDTPSSQTFIENIRVLALSVTSLKCCARTSIINTIAENGQKLSELNLSEELMNYLQYSELT